MTTEVNIHINLIMALCENIFTYGSLEAVHIYGPDYAHVSMRKTAISYTKEFNGMDFVFERIDCDIDGTNICRDHQCYLSTDDWMVAFKFGNNRDNRFLDGLFCGFFDKSGYLREYKFTGDYDQYMNDITVLKFIIPLMEFPPVTSSIWSTWSKKALEEIPKVVSADYL